MKKLLILLLLPISAYAECWVSTTTGQTICNNVAPASNYQLPPPVYALPPPAYYTPPPTVIVVPAPPAITPGKPVPFVPFDTGRLVPRGGTKE